MEDPVWYGEADCADGTTIRRIYDFNERTYLAECKRQHEIEEELISEACEEHGGCEFYSVGVHERNIVKWWLV